MDQIIIENLQIYAHHGVYREENEKGQKASPRQILLREQIRHEHSHHYVQRSPHGRYQNRDAVGSDNPSCRLEQIIVCPEIDLSREKGISIKRQGRLVRNGCHDQKNKRQHTAQH